MIAEHEIVSWLVAHSSEASLFLRCLLEVAKCYASLPSNRQGRCKPGQIHNVPQPIGRARAKTRADMQGRPKTNRAKLTARKKRREESASQLRLFAKR